MRTVLGALCAALVALCAQAQAQTYPAKPVRIIVPYAPGGIVDTSARVIAQKLTERWGQQVVVENRPGGNGFIGTVAAAKSPADGYTLLVAHTGEFAVSPAVFPDIPYDLDRDFIAITMITDAPMVIVVNSKTSYQTLPELIGAAKAKPGTVGVSTPGVATINHLVLEWMGLATGTHFLHVPYKGGAPAITATAGGEVPAGKAALGSAIPHIKTGRVRVLAVTTAERSFVDTSWPTMMEAGVPGVSSSIWAGLFAPKGVPQPIIDRIYADVAEILKLSDVRERFAAGGGITVGMPPAQFAAAIHKEADSLRVVVAKAGVKPE
jgi:tripartite-type tricarboxylate transporter receptor subunit TctC